MTTVSICYDYCWYTLFLISIFIFIYCILGLIRVTWSLLILINLYIKLFILVSGMFVYCDLWFSFECDLFNASITLTFINIGTDEFRYVYFTQSGLWYNMCLMWSIFTLALYLCYICYYILLYLYICYFC